MFVDDLPMWGYLGEVGNLYFVLNFGILFIFLMLQVYNQIDEFGINHFKLF